jgi:aryl-alcohol dehydrogenase-like predicted oxidoreductase
MHYRTLGRTGLKVSEVGFGAWAIGGPWKLGDKQVGWGKVDDGTSKRALETAFDLGITFYDTADAYGWGHSEGLVGEVFKGRRDKVIIATKVGNRLDDEGNWVKDFSRSWVEKAVEASLKRLQTDHIDFYQLHSPLMDFEFTAETFEVFEDLKKQGKIRFYGTSVKRPPQGEAIADLDKGDGFQVIYNIFDREPEEKLFPLCLEKNLAVVARVPLASGFLTGKFKKGHTFAQNDHRSSLSRQEIDENIEKANAIQSIFQGSARTMAQVALQFVLSNKAVSVVIPGAKTPEQVRDNAAASDGRYLTQEEITRIISAVG